MENGRKRRNKEGKDKLVVEVRCVSCRMSFRVPLLGIESVFLGVPHLAAPHLAVCPVFPLMATTGVLGLYNASVPKKWGYVEVRLVTRRSSSAVWERSFCRWEQLVQY
jgi:hypothetical protein